MHELTRHRRHRRDRLACRLHAMGLVVLVLDQHAVEPAHPVGRQLGERVRDHGRQARRGGVPGSGWITPINGFAAGKRSRKRGMRHGMQQSA